MPKKRENDTFFDKYDEDLHNEAVLNGTVSSMLPSLGKMACPNFEVLETLVSKVQN